MKDKHLEESLKDFENAFIEWEKGSHPLMGALRVDARMKKVKKLLQDYANKKVEEYKNEKGEDGWHPLYSEGWHDGYGIGKRKSTTKDTKDI